MNTSRPIVIGLTGNIGVGKSAVLTMLQALGARIVDADKVAHEVIAPGNSAYDAVVTAFGDCILNPDGTIDRAKLADIVFTDHDQLRRLERIIHPAVEQRISQIVDEASEPVVAIEAIKLLESRLRHLCDTIWVVTASRETQLNRLVRQKGLDQEEALRRMAAQSPQSHKVREADVVINNDGDIDQLQAQVKAAWDALMAPGKGND
ncbi:MAG TPA: dephospho-CoA kinase [Anaerolineae bacterium]|nr:dephospho-CoA kinase [Anaerolineae bacterium]